MHEPLPVRTRSRGVPVQRLPTGALPAPALRTAARPVRPPPSGRGTAARRRARRAVGARRRARAGGGRPPTRPTARHSLAPQRARAGGALGRYVALSDDVADAWRIVVEEHDLTGRGAARVRRVARTLADLDDAPDITAEHIVLAASLRGDVP